MKRGIIPVFVPHKGCPNDCVFCNQKRITGISVADDFDEAKEMERIDELVSGVVHTFDCLELAFYGGSFTAIPEVEMMAYLKKAFQLKKSGSIDRIRLSTRPDTIDEAIVKILTAHGVDTVELGVQSLDDEVLKQSKRGCSARHVEKAACLLKNAGIELGFQLMIGLPSDTAETSLATAKSVATAAFKPDFVRIYPALVIEDTEMADLYRGGLYQPFTLEEAVAVSAAMVDELVKVDIPVIRIGLQPTENMVLGRDIIAGPFHPSFRQMVDTVLMIELLKAHTSKLLAINVEENENLNANGALTLEIWVPRKHMSTVKGLSKTGEQALQQWWQTQVAPRRAVLSIRQMESGLESSEDALIIKLMPSKAERNVILPRWKPS